MSDDTTTTSRQPDPRLRRTGVGLALAALVASAVYGGNFFGIRTQLLGLPTPEAPATSRVVGGATASPETAGGSTPEATLLRSQPWWQSVDSFDGATGTAAPSVAIDDTAVQWRVEYSCQAGRLVVQAPALQEPLVDASCPADDVAYATRTGALDLEVTAGGPWRLQVDQQVEVPLEEPPLPAMQAPGARRLTSGTFYDIDQSGRGRVIIYRLPDGGHALRLDGFFVTPNVDLEVRLSPLERPETTEAFRNAPSVIAAGLDATAGSMNFRIPEDIDPTEYESVVIWCPPVLSAYAAASLEPVR